MLGDASRGGCQAAQSRSLVSVAGSPCQDDQEHPIGLGICWALHLRAENEQLLTKQHVFGDKIRLGAGKIREQPAYK
jgi:hypothetical protein